MWERRRAGERTVPLGARFLADLRSPLDSACSTAKALGEVTGPPGRRLVRPPKRQKVAKFKVTQRVTYLTHTRGAIRQLSEFYKMDGIPSVSWLAIFKVEK